MEGQYNGLITCSAEATLVPTLPDCPCGSSMFRSRLNPTAHRHRHLPLGTDKYKYFAVMCQILSKEWQCISLDYWWMLSYPASSDISCISESTWFWNTHLTDLSETSVFRNDTFDVQTVQLKLSARGPCMWWRRHALAAYLRRGQRGRAAHGVLHVGRLHIQGFKLMLKLIHEAWDLKRTFGLFSHSTLSNVCHLKTHTHTLPSPGSLTSV